MCAQVCARTCVCVCVCVRACACACACSIISHHRDCQLHVCFGSPIKNLRSRQPISHVMLKDVALLKDALLTTLADGGFQR